MEAFNRKRKKCERPGDCRYLSLNGDDIQFVI